MRLFGLALLLTVTVIVFRGLLFQDSTFSFRDTAHFYAPLWEYIQTQWQAGEWPLWNPLENGGVPLAGMPTAAVFYPGKLLFLLPMSFRAALELYVILHVVLAGITMYALARRWNCSVAASILAGMSYCFCGNVIFQHCNVVFLCGAAWLPAALSTGGAMIEQRDVRSAVKHGLILGIMVLSGDAQLAYLAGTCSGLYALICWLRNRSEEQHEKSVDRLSWRRLATGRIGVLALAAVTASGASSIQIIPSAEFSRRSVRAQTEVPRNIYGIPGHLVRSAPPLPRPDTGQLPNWYDALIGNPPPPAKHDLAVFHFQVEPWRSVEFLYPSISGAVHRRWGIALGIEGNTWTPTFYMGALPCLLAMASLCFRRGDARILWVTWIALIALLASFGSYTPWRLIRWLAGITGGGPTVDSVGGIYWLLQILLPGFSGFRYPGKLLVLTSAAMSVLAARGWDQSLIQNSSRLKTGTLITSLVSFVLAGAAFAGWSIVAQQIDVADQSLFDAAGVKRDVVGGFAHTGIALLCCFAFIHWQKNTRLTTYRPAILLLVTAVDLAIAHQSLVETVPNSVADAESQAVQKLRDELDSPSKLGKPPLRVFSLFDRSIGGLDPSWRFLAERQYLDSQFHLRDGISAVPQDGTMQLNEVQAWFDLLPYPVNDGGSAAYIRARRALDAWGVQAFFLSPDGHREFDPNLSSLGLRTQWEEPRWSRDDPQLAPYGETIDRLDINFPIDVIVNPSAMPRTWIVHDVVAIPPIDHRDRERWLPILQAIVFPDIQWIDLRSMAVVEDPDLADDAPPQRTELVPESGVLTGESAEFQEYTSTRVELNCRLNAPGVVVLSDTHFPGWSVEVSRDGKEWQRQTLLKTNLSMRGVSLPKGDWRIRFEYRPTSFRLGAIISMATWCTVLIGLFIKTKRQHHNMAARIS